MRRRSRRRRREEEEDCAPCEFVSMYGYHGEICFRLLAQHCNSEIQVDIHIYRHDTCRQAGDVSRPAAGHF
jgi:hypothetical protein